MRAAGATRVAKSKSMATEEIDLNPALEAAGAEVVETDLGEWIIQLAGETPSHIIAPALHKDRHQIKDLFVDTVAAPPTLDTAPTELVVASPGGGCARCSSPPTSASPAPTSRSPRPARSCS